LVFFFAGAWVSAEAATDLAALLLVLSRRILAAALATFLLVCSCFAIGNNLRRIYTVFGIPATGDRARGPLISADPVSRGVVS